MAQSIAFFQFSTEEDLSFVLEFSGLVLSGREFEIKVTERASNTTRTTLTNGEGITISGGNVLEAYFAKADMVGWARGEYSADVVDITGGGASRIQAVRFDYNLPGRIVQGVQDRKAYINWSPNQAVVTSTGAIGPKGAKGDKGDQGDQGDTGPSGTVAVGEVTTGAPGSDASVTNVGTSTAAIFDFEIPAGAQGIQGLTGNKGWSPSFAVVADGTRRVLQVDDWAGGEGTKPATGDYVGPTGLTTVIGDAVDIRGPAGSATIPDGDKGDVTTADEGDTWTLNNGVVGAGNLAAGIFANQATVEAGSDEGQPVNSLGAKQSIVANGKDAVLTDLAPWISAGEFPTVIQYTRERISLTDDRSVDRTGVDDVSAKAIAAIQHLNSRGGGKLVIPYGTYKVGASIQAGTLGTGDIEIEWEAGAVLKAATGLAVPVLDLRPSVGSMTDRRLILTNARIDCSAGSSPSGGGQYCVAVAVQYYRNVEILNPDLYGGEEPDNLNCDSLITGVANDSMLIDGGRLRGGNDSGVYVNADNDGATTSVVRIIGTHISRCKDAVSAKRDLALLAINGATVEECVAGIVGTYVPAGGGQPFTPPPRLMEITDTTFRKVTANVIRFTGPTKGRVADCTIEDFGYFNFDGTGSAGTDAIAIRLYGSSGLAVQNNRIGLRYWTRQQHIGIYSQSETLDGTPYTAGGNHFSGNTYKALATGISEASGINPSTYLNEVFDDVTNQVGGFFGASGSLITSTEVGTKRQFVRTGNSVVPLTRGLMTTSTSSAPIAASASGGTYRNDGATGLVTLTLPAASEGLEFSFIVSDADGIRVQTSGSGQFIYLGSSNSTSGGYAQSTTPISTLTLRAINTTIWVATAQTGTWTAA